MFNRLTLVSALMANVAMPMFGQFRPLRASTPQEVPRAQIKPLPVNSQEVPRAQIKPLPNNSQEVPRAQIKPLPVNSQEVPREQIKPLLNNSQEVPRAQIKPLPNNSQEVPREQIKPLPSAPLEVRITACATAAQISAIANRNFGSLVELRTALKGQPSSIAVLTPRQQLNLPPNIFPPPPEQCKPANTARLRLSVTSF